MRTLAIEGGLYILFLFTPFAFGGVESWALGVIQILTGIVFAAWAWGAFTRSDEEAALYPKPSRWPLFVPVALFTALVVFQLVPLPASLIKTISPATYDLYARTLPGFAEREPFDPAKLDAWLVAQEADKIPDGLEPPVDAEPPPPPSDAFPALASPRRTLSIDPYLTRRRLTTFLCFAALFAVVLDYFGSRKRLTRLLDAVVFTAFAVSFMGIIQKITWNEKIFWIREGSYKNVFGPFVNRNNYAAFAGLILPIAVCVALGALRKVRSGDEKELPRLVFTSFAAVVIGGGIFYSLSRGGMLTAGLSTVIVTAFLLYYGRNGLEMGLMGALLVVSVGFLIWIGPEAVVERVGTLSQASGTPSLALRITAWKRAIAMIGQNPIAGTGLGTFSFAFIRYAPPGRAWWTQAHNEYLEVLCDTGLAGGLLVLSGILLYLRRIPAPSAFRGTGGSERYVYAGLVAGILSLVIHSAASSNLQIPANGLMLVVLAGALLNLTPGSGSRRRRRSRSSRREAPEAEAEAGA